ncbi:MAG: hypothetical protein HY913_22630 [Desulfomonile tiedjei]|nr:hypothetical protein [Desulfomonile tiedjei]
MKKQVAIALAVVMVLTSVALALAGPKGVSRGSGGYTSGNKLYTPKPVQPAVPQAKPGDVSGKAGGIQDLGLNPSAKTPADMLKGQSATGAAPGAAVGQQAAPRSAFGGSGGFFGGSWMSWAFIGYLFGRHQQPVSHKAAEEIELVPVD